MAYNRRAAIQAISVRISPRTRRQIREARAILAAMEQPATVDDVLRKALANLRRTLKKSAKARGIDHMAAVRASEPTAKEAEREAAELAALAAKTRPRPGPRVE